MIKAITFDLWDTVIIDDSDEPKRKTMGIPSKPVERRDHVYNALKKKKPIPRMKVDTAYNAVDTAFRHVWYNNHVTWSVKERLQILLDGLDRKLSSKDLLKLVHHHEEMELEIKPDLAPGISDVLGLLHRKYRLGVISDTIFSPGHTLRSLLEHYKIKKYFDTFTFSDEIGRAKPDPAVFKAAANSLSVKIHEIVHIGDREEKDIDGPHAVGAKAILTTVVKDRGSSNTKADAVCTDYTDLPNIIDQLNK
ncbi:MAG: HAD family hydrolase [Deltaproteobacteria bacterium]|nr:HAD family hydrolase [Deltaproteobacteria bacterium]MBW1846352.1 HAD family hydrolase [Deltaproteobacteria bacterium]MBW1985101.1 HAD family hydrolase [Deltaproteobacteria bacterium]MBW2179262.1 HAD family hydrolase [Deltaproteobacteria bacterium]